MLFNIKINVEDSANYNEVFVEVMYMKINNYVNTQTHVELKIQQIKPSFTPVTASIYLKIHVCIIFSFCETISLYEYNM